MRAYFGRRTAMAVASVSVAVAVGCGGVALAVGGTSGAQELATASADKVVVHSRTVGPAGVEGVNSSGPVERVPAHMLAPDAPPPAPGMIRVTNAWEVGNGSGHVVVYAGSAADDPSTGRFMIVRDNAPGGGQTVRTVDVPASGAVSITNAPTGAGVETSAQAGEIGFEGTRGKAGVLSLRTETTSTP